MIDVIIKIGRAILKISFIIYDLTLVEKYRLLYLTWVEKLFYWGKFYKLCADWSLLQYIFFSSLVYLTPSRLFIKILFVYIV